MKGHSHFFPSTPKRSLALIQQETMKRQNSVKQLIKKTNSESLSNMKGLHQLAVEEMSPRKKTVFTMQTTEKKILDDIGEINHQIYQSKIPFLSYYYQGTEALKPKKEILVEMKNKFKFFNSFAVDPQCDRYRVKDFYMAKSTSTSSMSSPKEAQIKKIKSPKEMRQMSLDLYQGRHLEVIEDQEKQPSKKITEGDETGADMLLTTDNDTPPESEDFSSRFGNLKLPLRSPSNGLPFDLAKGEQKRKRVLQEIKKKKDMKNIMNLVAEQTEETNVRNLFALQVMKYQENVLNSYSKKKDKLIKKIDFSNKDPYNNAYYQILALPSPRRRDLVGKLNLTPIGTQQNLRSRSKASTIINNN